MKLSVRNSLRRLVLTTLVLITIGVLFFQSAVNADPIPKGWQASNMKAIAYGG